MYYFSDVSLLDARPVFLNDAAPPAIYTLSLHDALPILPEGPPLYGEDQFEGADLRFTLAEIVREKLMERLRQELHQLLAYDLGDRKSTRLNSSHMSISYAVFCLKKKKIIEKYESTSPHK